MSDGDWTWELASKAQDDLAVLDPHEQDRILDKLDEIVDSPWRDPPEYGEPLRNSPRKKVRVGEFRLAVTFRQKEQRMVVARIKRRGGAYTADDDRFHSEESGKADEIRNVSSRPEQGRTARVALTPRSRGPDSAPAKTTLDSPGGLGDATAPYPQYVQRRSTRSAISGWDARSVSGSVSPSRLTTWTSPRRPS